MRRRSIAGVLAWTLFSAVTVSEARQMGDVSMPLTPPWEEGRAAGGVLQPAGVGMMPQRAFESPAAISGYDHGMIPPSVLAQSGPGMVGAGTGQIPATAAPQRVYPVPQALQQFNRGSAPAMPPAVASPPGGPVYPGGPAGEPIPPVVTDGVVVPGSEMVGGQPPVVAEPPVVAPPGTDALPEAAAPTTEAPPVDFAALGLTTDGAGVGSGPSVASNDLPPILGDRLPIYSVFARALPLPPPNPPPTPETGGGNLVVRRAGLKMADNQMPIPVTRFYFSYNHFQNANEVFNERLNLDVESLNVDHYLFGYEQAFWDNTASIGIRMPYDVLTYTSTLNGNKTNTDAIGDISTYFKYLLWRDASGENLVTAGLLLTFPTGPQTFADSDIYVVNQTVSFDPFLGYHFQLGERAYIQGFSGMSIPGNNISPTWIFNDFQLGYFLYRAEQPNQFLTAIVPLLEWHINTPLSNRGFSAVEPYYGIDTVTMNYGTHVILRDRAVISVGVGTPLTGPKPFDTEVLVLFNLFLGGNRRSGTLTPQPML